MSEREVLGVNEETPPDEGAPAREKAQSFFQQHPSAKWGILAILVVAAVAGYFVWLHYASRESTDDAQIDGNIVPIAARVSGTVIEINVEDNQEVKASTVLVRLDPRDYQVALARAQAELADTQAMAQAARIGVPITSATATSQLRNAEAGGTAAQQMVDMARGRLAEAEANVEKAAADERRYGQLVEKNEIPRQQYDNAVSAAKAARAAADAARAAVANAESQVRQAEAQVTSAQTAPQQITAMRAKAGSAEAAVQRAQAALEQAKLDLQYTTIVASVSGVISKKQNVQMGQIVQAGQPLMAVVPLDDIWVTANFKETQLKNMRPGQHAVVHVDAYGRDFNAVVGSVGAATGARFSLLPPENATGNYVKVIQRLPVKLIFEKGQDPQHLLRPGMSVVPTVITK